MGLQSASTVVGAMTARSAVVHKYASTVAGALCARSAVGHKSASTVVCAPGARSARSSECIINQITTSQSVLVFTHSSRTHPPNKSPAVRVNLLVHVELGGFVVTPVQVPLILRRRYSPPPVRLYPRSRTTSPPPGTAPPVAPRLASSRSPTAGTALNPVTGTSAPPSWRRRRRSGC